MAVIKNAANVGPNAPGRPTNTNISMAGSAMLAGISGSKMPRSTAAIQVNPKASRKKNTRLRGSHALALYPSVGVVTEVPFHFAWRFGSPAAREGGQMETMLARFSIGE